MRDKVDIPFDKFILSLSMLGFKIRDMYTRHNPIKEQWDSDKLSISFVNPKRDPEGAQLIRIYKADAAMPSYTALRYSRALEYITAFNNKYLGEGDDI